MGTDNRAGALWSDNDESCRTNGQFQGSVANHKGASHLNGMCHIPSIVWQMEVTTHPLSSRRQHHQGISQFVGLNCWAFSAEDMMPDGDCWGPRRLVDRDSQKAWWNPIKRNQSNKLFEKRVRCVVARRILLYITIVFYLVIFVQFVTPPFSAATTSY